MTWIAFIADQFSGFEPVEEIEVEAETRSEAAEMVREALSRGYEPGCVVVSLMRLVDHGGMQVRFHDYAS